MLTYLGAIMQTCTPTREHLKNKWEKMRCFVLVNRFGKGLGVPPREDHASRWFRLQILVRRVGDTFFFAASLFSVDGKALLAKWFGFREG